MLSLLQSSKFALQGFAQALQQELYSRNILVSQCFPPDTDTPLLASENLQKPHITKLLSESSATVPAATVAVSAADGLQHWRPTVPVGFDGWMLATLTAGMGPAGTLVDALVQVLTLGLWRLVALFYVQYWYRGVIARHDTVPAKAISAAGAGSGAGASAGEERGGRAKAAVGAGSGSLSQPLVGEDAKRK